MKQKIIYLHDSTCKGSHCFRGGGWIGDIYYDTTSWVCWECGKSLGKLIIPRYRIVENQ